MTAPSLKARKIILIALAVLLLTAMTAVGSLFMVNTVTRLSVMDGYFTPYGEAAVAYLAENEAFTAEYGEVSLNATGYTYNYLDPYKYSPLPFKPGYPPTAEAFEAELAYLTVSVRVSGVKSVNVLFEKTPEGGLEITGWEKADE